MTTEQIPAIFLSHGAPPLADDPIWPGELAAWSSTLPRPKAILMISAHWENAPLAIGTTRTMPVIHDFWGFPDHYFDVQYPAPGAPEVADSVRKLLGGPGFEVTDKPDRGLDHGAYVPLVEMFPAADIPTLQISMPTLDPAKLFEIGRKLAPLRQEGVLVVGSGFFTHNLAAMRAPSIPTWSTEFDAWGLEALKRADMDSLINFEHAAPVGQQAHPRTEHFAPLFITLGMADVAGELDSPKQAIEGFWWGLSKRSVQFG